MTYKVKYINKSGVKKQKKKKNKLRSHRVMRRPLSGDLFKVTDVTKTAAAAAFTR